MSVFGQRIKPHVDTELHRASEAEAQGDTQGAFSFLERAHILGQASTAQHLRTHARMLAWAWRERDLREMGGQLLRLVGAATKTVFWIPVGNTGGANVSPFKSMPIPDDLRRLIAQARDTAGQR